ncbi:MAG: SMC family ATPase [Candidatus Zixiibacteriota bacterium]
MKLIALEVKNYRVLKRVSLRFPDAVIGIHGPNGAGKSSLVESIAWALYGTPAARTGRDEVKSGFASPSDNCEVALTFNVRGEDYRVERRLIGKTDRAEVKLFRSERSESVGVTDTEAAISQLIGLDWLGFRTSFLARQAELSAFTDVVASKRREHLTRMLGIERLDSAIKNVRTDSRTAEEKAAVVGRQLSDRNLLLADIESLGLKIADAKSEANISKSALAEADKKLAESTAYYSSMVAKHARFKELSAMKQGAIEKRDTLAKRLEGLRRESADLVRLSERARILESETAGLEKSRLELAELRNLKERAVLVDSLKKRRGQLVEEVEKKQVRLGAIEVGLLKSKEMLATLPTGLPEMIADKEKRLAAMRDDLSGIRARKTQAEKEAAKLSEKLGSIESLGPGSECDRCRRPLGDDFATIRAHFENDLLIVKADIGKLSAEESTLTTRGTEEKRSLETLTAQMEEARTLDAKALSLEKERTQISEDMITVSGQLAGIEKELAGAGEAVFDENRCAALEFSVKKMEAGKSELDILRGQLGRSVEVERQTEDISNEAEEAIHVVSRFETELAGLNFDEQLFLAAEVNRNEAAKEREEALARSTSADSHIRVMEMDMKGKEEAIARLVRLAQEREQFLDEQHYLQKLSSIFGDFREGLIAQIRPTLAELSSGLYAEVTNGKYALIELDDDYEMRIMDASQFYGIRRFSGGEKDLANLCLRLAISLSISMSAGLERGFIILDEVFGSQDSDRKELILKAMVNLRERFPQIFLITHTEEIKNRVEQLIEVRPTAMGYSEIAVNGVVAV